MSGVHIILAAVRKLLPITLSAIWGTNSVGAYPGTPTSAARTLTVPGGNPGNTSIALSGDYDGTPQYQYDGGAWTTFANGDPLTVTNGKALAWRNLNMASPTSMSVTLTDLATSAVIGTWTGFGI